MNVYTYTLLDMPGKVENLSVHLLFIYRVSKFLKTATAFEHSCYFLVRKKFLFVFFFELFGLSLAMFSVGKFALF